MAEALLPNDEQSAWKTFLEKNPKLLRGKTLNLFVQVFDKINKFTQTSFLLFCHLNSKYFVTKLLQMKNKIITNEERAYQIMTYPLLMKINLSKTRCRNAQNSRNCLSRKLFNGAAASLEHWYAVNGQLV